MYADNHEGSHPELNPKDRFLSRLPQNLFVKKNPDLKRHYPELWGRDLGNHWDPTIHQKPFVVAMKAPDQ